MLLLPIKLVLISFISIPTTIAIQSAPILQFIYEFTLITIQINRMMLSVSFLWFWELAMNTAFVDLLAIILSVIISTKVLLDIFSYEIVFTYNSDNSEYEQQVNLN